MTRRHHHLGLEKHIFSVGRIHTKCGSDGGSRYGRGTAREGQKHGQEVLIKSEDGLEHEEIRAVKATSDTTDIYNNCSSPYPAQCRCSPHFLDTICRFIWPTLDYASPQVLSLADMLASLFLSTDIIYSHTQQQHQIEPVTQPDGSLSVIEGEKIPRSQIYGERAQRLSERFGLQVDASNLYSTDGHVLRVHKPIRMRVHRECHLCGGSVNTTGLCDKCQHTFCHQCTRYPPKRSECERLASRAHRTELQRQHDASAIIAPDLNMDNNHQPMAVLRMPPRPATQRQLVHKKIRQRVRRTCCKCQEAGEGDVLFVYAERECSKCRHARCTDCPRDP